MFFHIVFFRVFLRFSMILAAFWEALAPPKLEKIAQDAPKIKKGHVLDASFFEGGFEPGFLMVFGNIFNGFLGLRTTLLTLILLM